MSPPLLLIPWTCFPVVLFTCPFKGICPPWVPTSSPRVAFPWMTLPSLAIPSPFPCHTWMLLPWIIRSLPLVRCSGIGFPGPCKCFLHPSYTLLHIYDTLGVLALQTAILMLHNKQQQSRWERMKQSKASDQGSNTTLRSSSSICALKVWRCDSWAALEYCWLPPPVPELPIPPPGCVRHCPIHPHQKTRLFSYEFFSSCMHAPHESDYLVVIQQHPGWTLEGSLEKNMGKFWYLAKFLFKVENTPAKRNNLQLLPCFSKTDKWVTKSSGLGNKINRRSRCTYMG